MAKDFSFTGYGFKRDYGFTIDDVRRADLADLQLLEKLVDKTTYALFGDITPAEILDKCHKSFCLENFEGETVAFMCFDDHPNIPSIPPWEWRHWLYNIYDLETITPRNSLWIHLAVWDKKYTYSFVAPMLKSVFATSSFLEYIILVVPPGTYKVNWLEGIATRIVPPGFYESHKVQTLYLLVRQNFITKYKIRRAVEEDNDDLVPLIHAQSEKLQQNYGQFYVAEILTRHPNSGRKLIVAEYEEHAVAVLFLNEVANLKLLNETFELLPFYGLRKPHDDDVFQTSPPFQSETALVADDQMENFFIRARKSLSEYEKEENRRSVSIGSFSAGSFEETIPSEVDSVDEFSIVDVASAHFLFESPRSKVDSLESSSSSSNYSAMILSMNDLEISLFADRSLQKITSAHEVDNHYGSKHIKNHVSTPLPTYFGESNAFTLEIAASKPEHEIESLALLLEAGFECFPDRDYCILSVPSTCPPFPLLKNFAKVSPRSISTYPHELYALHRNSVLSKIQVRVAVKYDIPDVENLISTMVKTEIFMAHFTLAVSEDEHYRAYLLLSEDQIVGVAILREEVDFEYLKSHYELTIWLDENHHKSGSHGLLEHLTLSPIFYRHACFFLREIHRLSDYSVLYYCIHPSDTTASHRQRSLCCVMSDLVPITPRPKPEFNHSDLEGCSPSDVVHRIDPPFALYISTARHSNLPRYEINTRIVVIGSSDIAVAFLESLICGWSTNYHIIFTNVTVVSPHGLNYQKPDHRIRDMLFVTKNNYNYRYMKLISLRTYINLVSAAMTGIDRKNKLVIVNINKCISYDLLFLMCGKQFTRPVSSMKDDKKKMVTEFPVNVFLVNTDIDGMHALTKLKEFVEEDPKQDYTVVVYGYVMEAYCCLAALIEFGVPPENITFVKPYPDISENKSEAHIHNFPDPEVDEAVHESIRTEGIKMYQSYYFCEWSINKELNRVTCVKFESQTRRIEVDCLAMFMYNDKTVSARTFMAISKAGLVFDGGLVIGPDCRTNDPNIYAAGTITKYSRRYYADHLAHKYYNLEEIGRSLGQQIRKKLIPSFDEDSERNPIACTPGNLLVPVYKQPLMTFCRLPGNLRYLSVTKPGKAIPLEVAMGSADFGLVFVTGDCKQLDKQGYFSLHLNQYGTVETITCLAKFDIDRKNLTSLWGKHEKLLNNLQTRFEMVLIADLFEYFREPWSCAIYHDRFPLLEKGINELLTCLTEVEGDSPIEDLMKMFKKNEWRNLSVDQHEEVEEKFMNSPYYKLLEQKVLDFIRDNITFLPMYAHPMLVRMLLQGYENSPLFEPQ